jgi:hypothetical protein
LEDSVSVKAIPIFTVRDGKVTDGALVREFTLSSGTKIPAILVGENGRGRSLGVLPVEGAQPGDTILAARIGLTRSGRPKLIAAQQAEDHDRAIVVFLTSIGFRGWNSHEGEFHRLASGIIAQGLAGRMGAGHQHVALLEAGQVVKVRRFGRLYGAPPEHHYMLRNGQLLVATPEERELAEIF